LQDQKNNRSAKENSFAHRAIPSEF